MSMVVYLLMIILVLLYSFQYLNQVKLLILFYKWLVFIEYSFLVLLRFLHHSINSLFKILYIYMDWRRTIIIWSIKRSNYIFRCTYITWSLSTLYNSNRRITCCIGAVLLQQQTPDYVRGSTTPIYKPAAFASRSLKPTEKNYSIIELEALAIWWSVIHKFWSYIEGQKFCLETDHKPLLSLMKKPYHNSRIERWMTTLQQYDTPLWKKINAETSDFIRELCVLQKVYQKI